MSTRFHPTFQFRGNSYFKSSLPSFTLLAKTCKVHVKYFHVMSRAKSLTSFIFSPKLVKRKWRRSLMAGYTFRKMYRAVFLLSLQKNFFFLEGIDPWPCESVLLTRLNVQNTFKITSATVEPWGNRWDCPSRGTKTKICTPSHCPVKNKGQKNLKKSFWVC